MRFKFQSQIYLQAKIEVSMNLMKLGIQRNPKDSKGTQRIPKEPKRFQRIPKDSKGFQGFPKDTKIFENVKRSLLVEIPKYSKKIKYLVLALYGK